MEMVLIVAGTAGALAILLVLVIRSRSGGSNTPVPVWEMRGQMAVPAAPSLPLADPLAEPDDESGPKTVAYDELEDDQDDEDDEDDRDQRVQVTATQRQDLDDTDERDADEQDEESLLDWGDDDDEK